MSPDLAMAVCEDALGRALLMAESDREVCGIVRRTNAEADGARLVKVETFIEECGPSGRLGLSSAPRWEASAGACLRRDSVPSLESRSRLGLASTLLGFGLNVIGF